MFNKIKIKKWVNFIKLLKGYLLFCQNKKVISKIKIKQSSDFESISENIKLHFILYTKFTN